MIKTIAKCIGWVILAVLLVTGWTVASRLASMPSDLAVFAGFAMFAAIGGTVIALLIKMLIGAADKALDKEEQDEVD